MKLSNFNVYLKWKNELFIYNTLSGGVLHLNKEYSNKFKVLEKDVEAIHQFPDLQANLEKGKMILNDNINEVQTLLTYNNLIRFGNKAYILTLAPTMKCNFICPYCYEVNKSYPKMDRIIIDKIKLLFKEKSKDKKSLHISWYGGEPLLAFDIIKELSLAAIDTYGENYSSSMVTNGYLFDDKIIETLEELRINDIQITLDGPPEIHNKRRKLPNEEDTFFVILQNMQRILELTKNVHINIRINTDKENIKYVDEILSYLDQYQIRDKVGLYLAPVDNINGTCNSSTCLNNVEFAKAQLDFIERNMKKGYNYFSLPYTNYGICGAVAYDNYVIDALGDIYKCWDDIACPERKVGNILDNEESWMVENLTKWLSYDIQKDDTCMKCNFLPLCMGGCPNSFLRNNTRKCIPIKENAEDFIKVLYEMSLAEKVTNK